MRKNLLNIATKISTFAVMLCLLNVQTNAQVDSLSAIRYQCGTTVPMGTPPVIPFSLVGSGYSPYPGSAIVSCGTKVKVYYDDIAEGILYGEHAGFDDTTTIGASTLGEIRRNTLCTVLQYIQNTFDFANVDTANPIRIRVMRSLNPMYYPAPTPTQWTARAFPIYDTIIDGVKDGTFAHYIKTGIDLDTSNSHGQIQVNFDLTHVNDGFGTWNPQVLPWHSGIDPVDCHSVDLFSTLLHEIGHCMGWFSLVRFTGTTSTGFTPIPAITTNNVFSMLDSSIFLGSNIYPLTGGSGLIPLINVAAGIPSLNPTAVAATNNNNYWINASEAPHNYAISSSGENPGQFISHLDCQPFSYTVRSRVSPGDFQKHVMGPYLLGGESKRKYTEGDLYGFRDVLGYNYDTAFNSVNPHIHIGNSSPYSTKMGSYDISYANYAYFTETVLPDDTLINHISSYLDINVDSITDLVDADGDTISIDTATLVNFRGCGISGNNHAALTWLVPGKIIRYTPRPNFYGKAQFGFNITDGIKNGSFVVFTIEVVPGTNVGCLPGENMVCNSRFEEGSEITTSDLPTIPNTAVQAGAYEGKWQGINFSDSHPYNFHSDFNIVTNGFSPSSGITIHNSYMGCATLYNTMAGTVWLSYEATHFGIDNPMPASDGKRYQGFRGISGSYYNMTDSAKHCKRYILEFDLHRKYTGFGIVLPLTIGFTDSIVDLSLYTSPLPTALFNYHFTRNIAPVSTHSWSHITIPFWYCGTDPSNILYLGNSNNDVSFDIDNLSLKEDTSLPLPLVVTLSNLAPVACSTQIVSSVENEACHLVYTWTTPDGTIISYSSDSSSIIVPYNTAATYYLTVDDGCRTASDTIIITDTLPLPITGVLTLCQGSTTHLSDATSGGTWSSSNMSIAIVNTSTGLVSGINTGTAIITYHYCSRFATATITVNALPATITGVLTVCEGAMTTLTSGTSGTWSSSNVAIATVGSSGIVTGMSGGTVVISYMFSPECYATAIMTIDPLPAPITGTPTVCQGATTILNSVTPSGTWVSSNTAIATIGSAGVVTGVSGGTTIISYILSTGCFVMAEITVNSLPATITGTFSVCIGANTILSNATASGTWSSSNTAIAGIGTSGIVSGVSDGTATITYMLPTGCFVTQTVSVNPLPGTISGTMTVCEGFTTTLTSSPSGGVWVSGTTTVATIGSGSGIVTGVLAGTSVVSYTLGTGCYRAETVTVNPQPSAISGAFAVCVGNTTTLSSSPSGGVWGSSTPPVASISPSGLVTALVSGTTLVTYTLPEGCFVSQVVTVNPLPAAISGTFTVCEGANVTLSSTPSGGTWSSSTLSVATIGSGTGTVTGVSFGTSTISYTLSTGCYKTEMVTVNSQPSAITGSFAICEGSTTALSSSPSGGIWNSSNTGVATIDGSGMVTAISTGTSSITYTLTGGCISVAIVTVNTMPTILGGTYIVCTGNTISLSSTVPGCSWSSSNTAVATVNTIGTVTGITAGTALITCISPAGCFRTVMVTVNPGPLPITGTFTVCSGATVTLSNATPGGTWSSELTSVATVNSITGLVTGAGIGGGGATWIYYTLSNGCTASIHFTVNPLPDDIMGSHTICHGSMTVLSTFSTMGTWISGTTSVATIGTSGLVTGVSPGTSMISYVFVTGCYRAIEFTVNPMPSAITGHLNVCTGDTTTLSNITPGGTWSSSDTTIGRVDTSGVVQGISTGTVVISYRLPGGCFDTAIVTVDTLMPIATAPFIVCVGNTITLSCATTGGTWSSSAPAIGIVGSATGAVTGIAVGTADITYIVNAHCKRSVSMNVMPAVASITATYNSVCYGSTSGIILANSTPGGVWSASSPATVGSSTGIVYAANPGTFPYTYTSGATAIIAYSTNPGCYTQYPVLAYHNDGTCSPCNSAQFGTGNNFNTIGMSGFIADALLAGNYHIRNNVTLTNNVVAQDAIMFMAPGVKMSVHPDFSFTSNGGHLFSCAGGMWKGIELLRSGSSTGQTARIVLQGSLGDVSGQSTLIEDAEIAVLVDSAGTPNSGGSYFVESHNTIFNRNGIGISVIDYTPAISTLSGTPNTYEFLIENTTFTGKNIAITGYPFAWPSNYGTGGLKTTILSTDYESPYNITTYTNENCHNGQVPIIGISLQNVGKTSGTSYAGAQIGEPATPPYIYPPIAPEWNLFDGLAYGIKTTNANLTVKNNVFQNLRHVITSGAPTLSYTLDKVGIFTNVDNAQKYQLSVVPATSGSGSYYTVAPNHFYNCNIGVYSNDYNIINCQQSDIRSTQTLATDGYSHYGFIVSSSAYEDIKINENSIFNMANGISFASSFTPGYSTTSGGFTVWHPEEQRLGNLEINLNTIQAALGTTTPSTQYLSFGIAVQNSLPGGGSVIPVGTANTSYNHIRDAHRGILVSGYQTQVANTIGNDITVMPFGMQKCWGINNSYSFKNIVASNIVNGVWNGNDSALIDSLRGYLSDYNSSAWYTCNYTDNTGRGYEFFNDNSAMRWMNNEMVRHRKGMVLNHSVIGPQGDMATPYDNAWSNVSWWVFGIGRFHTFVIDSAGMYSGSVSPLFVQSGSDTEPMSNWGNPPLSAYSMSSTPTGIIVTSSSPRSDCPIDQIDHVALRVASYEPPVRDEIYYLSYNNSRRWIAQYAAWEAVNRDSVLTDSSAVLTQFKTMAAYSRFAYLSNIEQMIAEGDLTSAATQLAITPMPISPTLAYDSTTGVNIVDDSAIDYIINTQKNFYSIYLRYIQHTMNSTDSVQLPYIAQLCPLEYGAVVYKARALYTVVFNDLRVWCEGCDERREQQGGGGGERPAIKPTTNNKQGQQYQLFPNPNDGNIILVQTITDSAAVMIDVSDILGRSVFKEEIIFSNNQYKIDLSRLMPGLFVSTVIDSKGRVYSTKFIKQ